jgi:hypothetical protein
METQGVAALSVTIALAVIGYAVAFVRSTALKRLEAKHDFVTAQLRDLYGPLYALTQGNTRTWAAFRADFRP